MNEVLELELQTSINSNILQAIVQTIREVVTLNPLMGQQINLLLHPTALVIDNPVNLCDLVASVVQSAETAELQAIMEEPNVRLRIHSERD